VSPFPKTSSFSLTTSAQCAQKSDRSQICRQSLASKIVWISLQLLHSHITRHTTQHWCHYLSSAISAPPISLKNMLKWQNMNRILMVCQSNLAQCDAVLDQTLCQVISHLVTIQPCKQTHNQPLRYIISNSSTVRSFSVTCWETKHYKCMHQHS